jgi:hypothetical protein
VANLPPVSTTPATNFATSFAKVVDTGGKFATGVNGLKFAAGISLTPLANLPLVLTTPAVQVANCCLYWWQSCHLNDRNVIYGLGGR